MAVKKTEKKIFKKKDSNLKTMADFSVLVNKKPSKGAYGVVNTAASSVTATLNCSCGSVDMMRGSSSFLYKCSNCGKEYAVSSILTMVPLKKDMVEFLKRKGRANF